MSPGPENDDRGFLVRFAGLPAIEWNALSVAIGIVVAFFAMLAGVLVVGAFDPSLDSEGAKVGAQAVLVLALAGTAIGYAMATSDGGIGAALDQFGLRRIGLSVVGLALLGWLAYAVIALVLGPLLSPDQNDVFDELQTDRDSAVSVGAAFALVIIGAAVAEELFFRGFVFAGLRQSMPLWAAALVSSTLWALLHLSSGDLGVVAILFAFGVVLCWLYERSGTLWAPLLAHGLNNTIAALYLFLS